MLIFDSQLYFSVEDNVKIYNKRLELEGSRTEVDLVRSLMSYSFEKQLITQN